MRPVTGLFFDRGGVRRRVRVRWGRILGALVLGAFCAGLLTATAAWGWLRFRRGIESIAWSDVALPHRWATVRMKLGEHYLREARGHLERREFAPALAKYRAGLSRSPRHLSARLELAELYLAYRRPDLAKKLLLDRLEEFASDQAYLHRCLQFLFQFQADAELHAVCENLLRLDPQAQIPAFYAASLALLRGDFDRAESLVREHRLDTATSGALLLARLDLERGFPELALARIERLLNEGVSDDECYALLMQIRRQLGQSRELELAATLRLAAFPFSHLPRIDFLHLQHERGDQTAFQREIDTYFAHFPEDQSALLALGDFAANKGLPELARRIENHFRTRDWLLEPAILMTAEAQLTAGNYSAGLAHLRAHLRDQASTAGRAAPVFDSLQALALFGLNRADEAQVHLERLLAQPNLRADNLQVIASRLLALGRAEHARTVLARAVALDPLNRTALTELIRLEAQLGHVQSLPAPTRRLLAMRRPSAAVLTAVRDRLGSDLQLFHADQSTLLAEIDRHLASTAPATLSAR